MSPIFKRAAISFSAPATSSAWARLSNWHGPAMIEIGKSLPNLTWPAVTTGDADILAFKGPFLFRRDHEGPRPRDQPCLEGPNIRVAPAGGETSRRLTSRPR